MNAAIDFAQKNFMKFFLVFFIIFCEKDAISLLRIDFKISPSFKITYFIFIRIKNTKGANFKICAF